MSAPMSAFIYHAPPYAFAGHSFHDLPSEAQEYLKKVNLAPPPEYDGDEVKDRRSRRARELYRTLDGFNLALVEHWREIRGIERSGKTAQTEEWKREALMHTRRIFSEMEEDLLPERKAHLDKFIIEFDALVWLDTKAREGTPDQASQREQQAYRDGWLNPILQYTFDALLALDTEVMKRDLEHQEGGVEPDRRTERMILDIQNMPPRGHVRVMGKKQQSAGELRKTW